MHLLLGLFLFSISACRRAIITRVERKQNSDLSGRQKLTLTEILYLTHLTTQTQKGNKNGYFFTHTR